MTSKDDFCHLPSTRRWPILSSEDRSTGCFANRQEQEREPMFHPNTVSSSPGKSVLLRSILRLLIVNAAIPYACYTLLKANHVSDVTALGIAAIAPALEALVSVLRSRQVNIISLFVLGGLLVGIITMFLGGDPRVVVLRESFFTGVLGLTCFVSLLFPRPLMFSVGRTLIAGNDPAHIARYNQLWQNPSVRHTARICTVVWGVVYSGDFLLHLLLVSTLPLAAVVATGPLLTGGLIGVALLWTFAYLRKARQRVQAMQLNATHEAGKAPSDGDRQSATRVR